MTGQAPTLVCQGGRMVVAGAVDAANVVALRQQGEALIAAERRDLVIDLSALETANSVVLSMLLCWQRLASSEGVGLTFEGVTGRLASLAALSNLDGELTRAG